METIRISVLGKFSIEYNGNIVSDDLNRSRKMWNLLAFIVMNHDTAITQSRFIDSLWSDDNSNPINALKTQLFRTREMLKPLNLKGEGCILSSRGAYSWNSEYDIILDAELMMLKIFYFQIKSELINIWKLLNFIKETSYLSFPVKFGPYQSVPDITAYILKASKSYVPF